MRPLAPSVFALLLASLLATIAGCGHHAHGHSHRVRHHHSHSYSGGEVALGVGLVVAGVALASMSDARPPPSVESVVIVEKRTVVVAGPPPAPQPPSRRDQVEHDALPQFDPIAARVALSAIDVSECRAAGAPSGRGHAVVTLNPDGVASKVVVDEPMGMGAAAVDCIGGRIGAVRVKPFRGNYVTVGTTWRVP